MLAFAPAAIADTGGAAVPTGDDPATVPSDPAQGTGGTAPTNPATTPGSKAKLSKDGKTAIPPANAPQAVKDAIYAANKIAGKPYKWGGGHGRWNDSGYDCSGAVSYALHGAGLIDSPGDAVVLGRLSIMDRGPGQWITYYWNHQHGFAVIAGLRWDTSAYGSGGSGPNWRKGKRPMAGFYVRHPEGY